MILSDLKRYLSKQQTASMYDLTVHFDTDAEAIRGMLNHWLRKGKVQKLVSGSSCNSKCCKCDCPSAEVYQWIT